MTYCQNCGQQIDDSAKYCSSCGKALKKENQQKNKFIAIALLLIFGYFGIHRYYLGDNKAGSLFFIGGLIAIFIASLNFSPLSLIPFAVMGLALLIDLAIILFNKD